MALRTWWAALWLLVAIVACAAPTGAAVPASPTAVAAARATVGPRLNPARHYGIAAAPSFWLKGDAPPHRDDPVMRRQVTDALDADVAVRRIAYEARAFDRQPVVSIVFAAGERAVQAFVYRPAEGLVYVVEDGIAFEVPPRLSAALAPVVSGPVSGVTPTPSAAPPQSGRPAPEVWRLGGDAIASDQGFRVARLGTTVQHAGGSASLAAFVAVVAPEGDTGAAAPAAGRAQVVDAAGGPHATAYQEVLRAPGVTVGAVLARGLPVGPATFWLEVGALDVARGQGGPVAVPGAWRVGLVEQLRELQPQAFAATTLPGGEQVVDVGGTRVRYATGFGGAAVAVERAGATSEPVYVRVAADMAGVEPIDRAIGDCYVARLYDPTPVGGGPPPATPSGARCPPLPAGFGARPVATVAPTRAP